MPFSIYIKSLMATMIYRAGLAGILLSRYSSQGLPILMYHRIVPREKAASGLQAGMYVEPETFEMHVRLLRRHFRVISLSEVRKYLDGTMPADNSPRCALTFDDGWADFHTYAFPILAAHCVPATVFLPTRFIGTADRFWTDRLAGLVYKMEAEVNGKNKGPATTDLLVGMLEDTRMSIEARLDKAIEMLKPLAEEKIDAVLATLRDRWKGDADIKPRDFLTWDQVREMRRSGLVSFGSHTHNHRILTALGSDEIDGELRKSKERLEKEGVVDPSFVPFAYPNGNYHEDILHAVKKHDYCLAVTTEKGWVLHSESDFAFRLKRIGLHQDMSSTEAMFVCRILKLV